jgi:tetratricopeptide (TPR) repeat protein
MVDRIVAAGDPTLVIVDDADRLAGLDQLVEQAAQHPTLIRLLVLSRVPLTNSLRSQTARTHLSVTEELSRIGAAGDHDRWFREAVEYYRSRLTLPPPNVGAPPVGRDEDTPLVLLARALLAVLGRAETQHLTVREIAHELLVLEQQHWEVARTHLPAGCDNDVLEEAVTVLSLFPSTTVSEAADLLGRVPQFAHETRTAVARWLRRAYPPGPLGYLDVHPYLLVERLVVDTLHRTPDLAREVPHAAVAIVAHACETYPDRLDVLVGMLDGDHANLRRTIPVVLAAGVVGPELDHALARLVTKVPAELARTIVVPIRTFPQLSCAVAALEVAHQRTLGDELSDHYRGALAVALNQQARLLLQVGRPAEALASDHEATWIARVLAQRDPDRFGSALASFLSDLGQTKRELGAYRAASAVLHESVHHFEQLVADDLFRHGSPYAETLVSLGTCLWDLGHPRAGLERMTTAVETCRGLAGQASDPQPLALVHTLIGQAVMLRELGQVQRALAADEEALGLLASVAESNSDELGLMRAQGLLDLGLSLRSANRSEEALIHLADAVEIVGEAARTRNGYLPILGRGLASLGACLSDVGSFARALAADEQAVAIRRALVRRHPERHLHDLATSLHDLGVNRRNVSRHDEALTALREAVDIMRGLVSSVPSRHAGKLAFFLDNLAIGLLRTGHLDEALTTIEEAVRRYEVLAEEEPDRYLPELAGALGTLADVNAHLPAPGDSVTALRKAVTVWQVCARNDPKTHDSSYQRARTRLTVSLARSGRETEAANIALSRDSARATEEQ